MGLRKWMHRRMSKFDGQPEIPPVTGVAQGFLSREAPREPTLGEYDSDSYPEPLAERLRRRALVTEALLQLDLTTADDRVAAIPRLQALLRDYPHPLLYEALINAYLDAGRWDDARGAIHAARDRRRSCERSPFPEIRAETDRLREWSTDEVDEVRRERETRADRR
jgi:hypothetical protein